MNSNILWKMSFKHAWSQACLHSKTQHVLTNLSLVWPCTEEAQHGGISRQDTKHRTFARTTVPKNQPENRICLSCELLGHGLPLLILSHSSLSLSFSLRFSSYFSAPLHVHIFFGTDFAKFYVDKFLSCSRTGTRVDNLLPGWLSRNRGSLGSS